MNKNIETYKQRLIAKGVYKSAIISNLKQIYYDSKNY